MNNYYPDYLRPTQRDAIESQKDYKKCLINMWCGTGKTRTFTIDLFINNEQTNVIVFPSLGLINQYCNDYALSSEEPFKTEFEKYNCLAFCSDDDGKLKSRGKIQFTTDEKKLDTFLKKKDNQIILVTYQSFEKFINICIEKNININNLIFDEAHHIVGKKIRNIVFNNAELDAIVDKTRVYTATPVNKNGITMYDRENPENSDCGPLAYKYLYYQAVEDGVCKPFETQISLYTQKPEYKDKYQPVFECIIRACLSGNYTYWNILTYHSFVNENENENENISESISYVKEFASQKNQKMVKKLFTRIQNEEFPDTKSTYSVENVILKGVYADTKLNSKKIEDDLNRKVEGRIYILASCRTLSEGKDTNWANMGVPINPTKGEVIEQQRIGRLVRNPEKYIMQPAIMLLPFQIDVKEYSEIDTPEQRDQMIREAPTYTDFCTTLNIISAFKYQGDPELFEILKRYPNMYPPKDVKDNLAKQGLIVVESKGDLLDNLKYVCEKEDIDLDIESFEGSNERDILKEIAEQCVKTIEVHTQNHDEPVKYVNEEASDEEPLRLFHCEDDNTYAPITKKDKKQKIKKKSTIPPNKRPKLFDVHQHPDLEVLWKIKEGSIDLNKTFSQGVLDVDINWNEEKWEENLEKVKEFMDENERRPLQKATDKEEQNIGSWLGNQQQKYKKKIGSMNNTKFYNKWTEFINNPNYKEYFLSNDEEWSNNLQKLKDYIYKNNSLPKYESENKNESKIARWIGTQNRGKNLYQNEWNKFIKDPTYKKYFINDIDNWYVMFDKVKEFIDKYIKRPSKDTNSKEERTLGVWLSNQLVNYKKKRRIMKDINIYNTFTEFINNPKYKEHFIDLKTKWIQVFEDLKTFIDNKKQLPIKRSINDNEKFLGNWIGTQKKSYKKKIHFMKEKEIYDKWTEFINNEKYKEYFMSNKDTWFEYFKNVKEFMDENKKRPNSNSKNNGEKFLGNWIGNQKTNYKKKIHFMKEPEIYDTWTEFINDPKYSKYFDTTTKSKKDMSKPEIKPKKTDKEIKEERQQRSKSELSMLHKEYKTKNSQNLNTYFKENPEKWKEYHKISQENEESFLEEEIPRNKMIKYLENLPGKKKKVIADLGCGFAEINQHFKDNSRFEFHNFDHHTDNDMVVSRDIKNTELDDYSVDVAILSLAMWGSNCKKDYLQEAHRILDTGGTLLIAEAYKRWNKELDKEERPINRLVKLLEENNFTIIKNVENKFMFIECRKN
jgi:superfamily II DNA or RNA helicase